MAVMSSTGTRTCTRKAALPGACTTWTGCAPPRKRATVSAGRTVAESPMRWAGCSSRPSSRSKLNARCAPRLLPASACTSPTMTACTVRSASRACDVSMRYSDSGVVMSTSGGFRWMRRRSSGVVSPVRCTVVMAGSASARSAMAASGRCRLRSTSAPRAFSGDTYSTRTPARHGSPASAAASFSRANRSMANRNAASVLPEPVGAMTKALQPAAMASHARAWAGVGSLNASPNQSRTGVENRSKAAQAPLAAPPSGPAAAPASR